MSVSPSRSLGKHSGLPGASADFCSASISRRTWSAVIIRPQALAAAKANSAEIQATNDRISQIDNYEAKQNIAVNFKLNSAVLSDEAKAALDEIAAQTKNEKGYLIQVTGYASADGPEAKNRALSERRAEAVRRYLAENHDIPLQRMINPFGFGELKPVAENNTREGRKQNRRVEVAILVNKGLTASASGRN
jgi:OmpA-OmpF porin, OOP family